MKFIPGSDTLIIKLEGWEMVWALKRQLVLPRKDIENLIWAAEFHDKDHAIKLAASVLPRLIFAGRFRDLTSKQNLFLFIRKPSNNLAINGFGGQNVLIVSMRAGRFRQVIVNCDPETGVVLTKWWQAGS